MIQAGEFQRLLLDGRARHREMNVSPDGRNGSLSTHQDALVYSGVLDLGHHLVYKLLPGRSAWLHIVYGEVTLQDLVLTQGDGVGISDELVA